jgi:hypothetical protein
VVKKVPLCAILLGPDLDAGFFKTALGVLTPKQREEFAREVCSVYETLCRDWCSVMVY